MPQLVGRQGGQNPYHLHARMDSGLNARTRVFENQALLWWNSQSRGGTQKAFRVWLTIPDLIDWHNDLRNW